MVCCSQELEAIDLKLMDGMLEKYGSIPGSLITILQQVQDIYGYLPRSSFSHISKKTGIKEAKIFGVATFYTQFRLKPVGEFLILLCQGTACHVNGSELIEKSLVEELKVKVGETTDDGLFTFTNVACLGCCSLAPVMMINDETYANLTPEKAVKIIRALREQSNRSEEVTS